MWQQVWQRRTDYRVIDVLCASDLWTSLLWRSKLVGPGVLVEFAQYRCVRVPCTVTSNCTSPTPNTGAVPSLVVVTDLRWFSRKSHSNNLSEHKWCVEPESTSHAEEEKAVGIPKPAIKVEACSLASVPGGNHGGGGPACRRDGSFRSAYSARHHASFNRLNTRHTVLGVEQLGHHFFEGELVLNALDHHDCHAVGYW
jgi:hypothetical protein